MSALILTFGPTHSGKTTFAKKLQALLKEQTKSILIDNDVIDEFVENNFGNLRTDPDVLKTRTPTNPDLRLRIPQLIADYALAENYNVIIAASHSRHVIRQKYYDIAKRHKAKVVLLMFRTPEEELVKRIQASNRKTGVLLHTNSFVEFLEQQKRFLEEPTATEKSRCFKVFEIEPGNTDSTLTTLGSDTGLL